MTAPSLAATGQRPDVAVVLCSFNGARYLPVQLQSLLDQTRRPDELVLVDDDSTDATWSILTAFRRQAEDAGIRVVLEKNDHNLGYLRNFEYAIGLAGAGLVFLCDQDDAWHVEKIARMEEVFLARPALSLLHTDARLVDSGGADMQCGLFEALEVTRDEVAQLHSGAGFDVLLRRNVVTGATAAFRRGALEHAIPFPDEWVHDEWLAMVCAARGEIDCLEEKLIDYRQHGGNQIGVRRRTALEKFAPGQRSRREHMRSVVKRLDALASHLVDSDVGILAIHQDHLEQRSRHAHARVNLPAAWPERWLWVGTEARSGRYGRYSFGLRSIVADLLGLD